MLACTIADVVEGLTDVVEGLTDVVEGLTDVLGCTAADVVEGLTVVLVLIVVEVVDGLTVEVVVLTVVLDWTGAGVVVAAELCLYKFIFQLPPHVCALSPEHNELQPVVASCLAVNPSRQ